MKEVGKFFSFLTSIDFITEGGISIVKSIIELIAAGKTQPEINASEKPNVTETFTSKSFNSIRRQTSIKRRTKSTDAKTLERKYTIRLRPSHLSIVPNKLTIRSLFTKIRTFMDKELSSKTAIYEHVFQKSPPLKYSTSTHEQTLTDLNDVLSDDSDELSDPLSENLSDFEDEVDEKPSGSVKRIHRQSILLTKDKFENPDNVQLDVLKLSKDPAKTLAMWSYYPQTVSGNFTCFFNWKIGYSCSGGFLPHCDG